MQPLPEWSSGLEHEPKLCEGECKQLLLIVMQSQDLDLSLFNLLVNVQSETSGQGMVDKLMGWYQYRSFLDKPGDSLYSWRKDAGLDRLTWTDTVPFFLMLHCWHFSFELGLFLFCSFWLSICSVTEIVGSDQRIVGIVIQIFFTLGIMLLPGIAYLVPTWQGIQLAISLPNFLFLLYYW